MPAPAPGVAEGAALKGLAPTPHDPGLLVSYTELCTRSDSFDHPSRTHRAVEPQKWAEEPAPPGSPERVDEARGWAGRSNWDVLTADAARGRAQRAAKEERSVLVAGALRRNARGPSPEGAFRMNPLPAGNSRDVTRLAST
ncbi:hypothetical protein ACFRH6_22055 [Streptomyces sp. NPDC056749]|uniref:hypothetical protein n=1 Tax=Streptomyces sp. NPDC056749 TaxID=3345936 RepID=UPI00369F7883